MFLWVLTFRIDWKHLVEGRDELGLILEVEAV